MKKRYLILAGILVTVAVAAGCGKKKEEETPNQEAQVTVAPAENTADNGNLVDMQQSAADEEDIKNVMGDKTETASKLVLINKTGGEVSAIYIRPHSDDDDWGDDLVNGMFTLKNGEKALYYFEKNAKDDDGNSVESYDIRISYTDEDRNECFFRMIPLDDITEISLCMEGTGEAGIPYARYLTGTSKKETSTLSEVKKRLGISDSDTEDTENDDDEDDDKPADATPTSAPSPSQAPEATPTPGAGDSDDPQDQQGDLDNQPDPAATVAQGYIGQSLDNLIGACGEPQGSEYQDEPDTGETGYHYYDTFTVSTTVDEDGNEIVSGIW